MESNSSEARKRQLKPFVVLRRRGDFLRLMKFGYRTKPTNWLLVNYRSNDLGVLRCGWTLPRKVGPAVIRNRLKRWAREYFRAVVKRDGNEFAVDLNLVFRKSEDDIFKNLDYDGFTRALDRGWSLVRSRVEGDTPNRHRGVSNGGH